MGMSFFKQWGMNTGSTPSNEEQERLAPVDESSKERERFDQELQLRLLEQSLRRLKRWMFAILVLLTLVAAALALAVTSKQNSKSEVKDLRPYYPVPPLPWTTTTFEKDDRFSSPSSQDSDEAWGFLMPPGDGFIFVPDSMSEKANLPPGKSSKWNTNTSTIYDTSLFHQLHCLSHIRTFTSTLQASIAHNNAAQVWDVLLKPQEDHVLHCFDYLRQGIMCAGDLTLEWPRTEPDGRRFAVDGWGVEHMCRSWDAIERFMVENSVTAHGPA